MEKMSKLDRLIEELCPDGVEYRKMGDLGNFYGGLSGKNKSDFNNGNKKLITYMNVFSNLEIDLDLDNKVLIREHERQNTIEYGDIIFTASSESLLESGMSSVLTTKTGDELYLNSFCFGFRLNNNALLMPGFSKYLFRSNIIRKQILRTVNGVTRYNISRKRMIEVRIPLPPLPIQKEIVRILDNFTGLTTELNEKLKVEKIYRKKQYEYYRDQLLTFGNEVEWKALEEVGTIERGNGLKKSDFVSQGYPCVHYGQIYTYYGTVTKDTISFVEPSLAEKLKKVRSGDLIIAVTSENLEDVCKPLVWLGENDIVTGGHTAIYRVLFTNIYVLCTKAKIGTGYQGYRSCPKKTRKSQNPHPSPGRTRPHRLHP